MNQFFALSKPVTTIIDDGISPLIISFDIGIKNLAYCLFYPIDASHERIQIIDWRIINLLETEEKKKHYVVIALRPLRKKQQKNVIKKHYINSKNRINR